MLCLPKTLHGCTVYVGLGSGTEKSTYISYIYVLYLAQVSKYLQTLALGIIISMLCLLKTLHGCTVYVGLGSGTKKSTYISNNYVLVHGLRIKYTYKIHIYLLYLCFVSSTSEQVPTNSSSRSHLIYAMSPKNHAHFDK